MLAVAGTAHAYPQFQLVRDETCSGCHISPAGGGLLNENGLNTAESMSQLGTDPEFLNGVVKPPSWLLLGGDLRAASGYLQTPQRYLLTIPMQADLYADAQWEHFTFHVTGGYRPPEYGNETATRLWSKEHYVQWQSDVGSPEGVFVRAGRLMPIFGLRLAEHDAYTRRYGGTPLYSETYGATVSYIKTAYEAHLSGWVRDHLIDPARQDDGGAAYIETRLSDVAAVGVEGMIQHTVSDNQYRGGVTGKYFLKGPGLLLSAEVQVNNQHIGGYGLTKLITYATASYFPKDQWLIDLGWGHYDENLRIKGLDRDALDLNVHWFTSSHFEALLNARVELIGQASTNVNTSGPTGAYVLLMGHYRL
ncbi:MAG: hypothetical protein JO257_23250 [Deltaproteobacteria bacterium]|nr:hypothetical protein [Deltaproteobacteria bacterium]